jgi:hypothetical protein
MPASASELGKTSSLNCGAAREPGIDRMSTRQVTCTWASKATNSSIGRVEWPMV